MTIEEIKEILAHRDEMLLVKDVDIVNGKAHGKIKIEGSEWFLRGHFPGNPVVPGMILCEMLAQSVCVCMKGKLSSNQLPLFIGLDKAKFRNRVKPGDIFETECEITKERPPYYFAKGSGFVDGKLCVSAEFSFAIIDKTEN